MRLLMLLVALSLVSTEAGAQVCGDTRKTLQSRATEIGGVATSLGKTLTRIEHVPPPDSDYIEKETAEAFAQHSEARYRVVSNHQFFHAHQVQKHYQVAKENLQVAINAKTVADQAVSLSVVLSRLAELSDALSDYYAFDAGRPNRVLSNDDVQAISFEMVRAKMSLLETMQCAIRQMREP